LLPASAIAYVAALGLLLVLPLDSYSKETYISENALLVNQVRCWAQAAAARVAAATPAPLKRGRSTGSAGARPLDCPQDQRGQR